MVADGTFRTVTGLSQLGDSLVEPRWGTAIRAREPGVASLGGASFVTPGYGV